MKPAYFAAIAKIQVKWMFGYRGNSMTRNCSSKKLAMDGRTALKESHVSFASS